MAPTHHCMTMAGPAVTRIVAGVVPAATVTVAALPVIVGVVGAGVEIEAPAQTIHETATR